MDNHYPLSSWLTRQGFTSNPFASKEADFEAASDPNRFSHSYFISDYWFSLIAGDWQQPRPALLYGMRGSGKSATRLALEYECRDNSLAGRVLATSYLDFEEAVRATTPEATRQAHLTAITRQVAIALFHFLEARPALLSQSLSNPWYDFFAQVLASYTPLLQPFHLEKLLRANNLLGLALSRESLDNLPSANTRPWLELLRRAKESEPLTDHPSRSTLAGLFEVGQQVGLVAIYVLLDRVDELLETAGDPQVGAKMLTPLLADLRLLELPGYGFKFFIPGEVFQALQQNSAFRADRLQHVEIRWTQPLLKRFLTNRLRAYSHSRISSLGPLCNENLSPIIDDWLVELAGLSPRNLLRLGELLITQHISSAQADELLSRADLENAYQVLVSQLQREGQPGGFKLDLPGELPSEPDSGPRLGEKGLRLDMARRMVWCDGRELAHPPVGLELDLLEYLYERAGFVISKEEIIRAIYREEAMEVEDQRLAKLVQRLRDKLEPPASNQPEKRRTSSYIVTIPREGYKLENRVL